ncbi:hypothetical protein ACHAW5_009666 [Stephanodiscus triporus]|uniref:Fe2OG dioxygenase domain-containing protein n=1 Tax=Stephanodiscus triporus TaxID=2934178 RepID=A0ABD3N214_9STRA
MVRRDTGEVVSRYAHHVGLPAEMTSSLLGYVDRMGLIDALMRHHASASSSSSSSSSSPKGEDGEEDEYEDDDEDEGDEGDENYDNNGQIVTLANNFHWYINKRRRGERRNLQHDKNGTNRDDEGEFVWYTVSPCDEITHQSYLHALSNSDFDVVLDAIGGALRLSSLAVYHVSLVGVFGRGGGGGGEGGGGFSRSRDDRFAPNIAHTDGTVYNVIVPLLLEYDDDHPTPELMVWDDVEGEEADEGKRKEGSKYEYQYGVGVVMGDDVVYDNAHDDNDDINYGSPTSAGHSDDDGDDDIQRNGDSSHVNMRLFVSVYIADIHLNNVAQVANGVENIAETTIFPLLGDDVDDERWLLSQEARHWRGPSYSETNRDGQSGKEYTMSNDKGRKAFRAKDTLEDCYRRANDGMCGNVGVNVNESVRETRKLCPFSCGLYIEEGLTTDIEWVSAGDIIQKDDRTMMPVYQQQQSVKVCTRIRTGWDECRIYEDDVDIPGDFISPKLKPGEMFPIILRGNDDVDDSDNDTDYDDAVLARYAFQVGLPPELTTELLAYSDRIGVTEELRKLTSHSPLRAADHVVHKFHKMADGNDWYVQRPPLKWTSNMHWISPADEKTHEEYLDVLARGNFDVVLDAVGKHLGLEGLVAYHLTFIGVSHSEKGFIHHDSTITGASVYNVIIPLILEGDASPELALKEDEGSTQSRYGTLKYRLGTAAMMGDDARHGTEACDYRESNGMRLAATVYIADISEKNAQNIATQTLTQIFPLADAKWLMAEAGRHWVADNSDGTRSILHNKGRKYFSFSDSLPDCTARAKENKCITDTEFTRVECLRSCGIYESNGYKDIRGCPVDEETNIFKPGDMNAMFERWLKEAGQDIATLSKDNLPKGGTISVGELNVVISPYHDSTYLPKDEDEDEEMMPKLPWVVSIDGFLSDEECERLIELGESIGYERSTESDYGADGTPNHSTSEGRTSYNTFCTEGCNDDPIVKRVIERMTSLSGIPFNNFESLQLVRYKTGQFYEQHHDNSAMDFTSSFGPRILTIFLYLNDVTSGLEIGGETEFHYLNFTATPKKGMALVWPSVMDNLEKMDDWTWHKALPVVKGVKYGANAWIHLRDYQNQPDYCTL